MSMFSFLHKEKKVNYSREDLYQTFGLIERNVHQNFILNGFMNETRDCRVVQGISLPYKGKLIPQVEVNLYNPYYFGNSTATCPTIPGTIAQARSNKNTLLDLYVAMSESLLLRSELGLKLVDYSFDINDQCDDIPLVQLQTPTSEIVKKYIRKLGFKDVYAGHLNYLCVHSENPLLILTLPKCLIDYDKHGNGIIPLIIDGSTGGVNKLTEFLISGMY